MKLRNKKGYNIAFEGFRQEAFDVLERLQHNPHSDQYQLEKQNIKCFLKEPFSVYRDDLVVNWVLPQQLPLETERNVFSRLLKNDFGAGGCHHHLWLSFYRHGYRRLTDVQLSHSIRPEGFDLGLFAGGYGKKLLSQIKKRISKNEPEFVGLAHGLKEDYDFYYRIAAAGRREKRRLDIVQGNGLPEDFYRCDSVWVRRRFPKNAVLQWKGRLVAKALAEIQALWPLYCFLLKADERAGAGVSGFPELNEGG